MAPDYYNLRDLYIDYIETLAQERGGRHPGTGCLYGAYVDTLHGIGYAIDPAGPLPEREGRRRDYDMRCEAVEAAYALLTPEDFAT